LSSPFVAVDNGRRFRLEFISIHRTKYIVRSQVCIGD
jgi:hypothetical protein